MEREKKKTTELALAPLEIVHRLILPAVQSLRGEVLEVLRTRAVYQCSTLLTMRVLAVLSLILRFSQVCRGELL